MVGRRAGGGGARNGGAGGSGGAVPRAAASGLLAVATVLLAVMGSGGCSPVHMVVPPDVSRASDVLEVRDRSAASGAFVDEGFSLGAYRVTEVDRDWSSTSSVGAGPVEKSESKTGYEYRLEAAEQQLAGRCAVRGRSRSVALGAGWSERSDRESLDCVCGEQARLHLETDDETYRGALQLGAGRYSLSAITEAEGGGGFSVGPVGYRADGNEPLAAVEVTHPGRIWLARSLPEPERPEVACLLVALLLYEPLAEE